MTKVEIDALLASLQIEPARLTNKGLLYQTEADELIVAEVGDDGREHRLIPAAAADWRAMKAAAHADGVALRIVSAFRSIERQAEIAESEHAREALRRMAQTSRLSAALVGMLEASREEVSG